ncbi:hypothetical protein LIER_02141 [Lithospermum erythrorhizon]|uniref:Uncharacterized protein n=1 Tax=Lithospermum erythrorhizon TaxID=34254 RepID=A0AAV3NQU5_LITER
MYQGCQFCGTSHGGSLYTKSRNWKEEGMIRVLDRVLCNHMWLGEFSHCVVNLPVPVDSDHCPLDITLDDQMSKEPKSFKYQAFWKKHDSFSSIIDEVWHQNCECSSLDILYDKLKRMRQALRKLNVDHFSHISSRVTEKKIELEG